jgi:hypothetical protein
MNYHQREIEREVEMRIQTRIHEVRKRAALVMSDRVCRCWQMLGVVTYGERLKKLVMPYLPQDLRGAYGALLKMHDELVS